MVSGGWLREQFYDFIQLADNLFGYLRKAERQTEEENFKIFGREISARNKTFCFNFSFPSATKEEAKFRHLKLACDEDSQIN